MSAIYDGGPAFPWEDTNDTPGLPRPSTGMSKREEIAKVALNGYLAGRNNGERTFYPGERHHADVAAACLRYADALLAALAPVEETHVHVYPNGAPVFDTDGTLLDSEGNRDEPAAEGPTANTLLQDMEVISTIAETPYHPNALPAIHSIADKAIAKARETPPALDTPREAELRKERNNMAAAINELLEMIEEPPDANCSCHQSAPCSDCVDHSGLRGAIAYARAAISIMTAKGE